MAKKSSGGGDHGRSAISGRFVTAKYAKSHPKTTVIEKAGTSKKPGGSPGGTKAQGKK
jgi:hypothetical protein